MKRLDTLGRATFEYIEPRPFSPPTERELTWLRLLARHGPLSSIMLFEATKETHRCKDTALRALLKLRAQGLLRLPQQQRNTAHAERNPFVYDLTPRGLMLVEDLDGETHIRPTGHWWHSFAVSRATASIEVSARRQGVRYLAAREFTKGKHSTLEVKMGAKKLRPDQLFALDYGGKYRVCALEVDRGTEPLTSAKARKTLDYSLKLYESALKTRAFNNAFGFKSDALVLYLFESKHRMSGCASLAVQATEVLQIRLLMASYTALRYARFEIEPKLITERWDRSTGEPVVLAG